MSEPMETGDALRYEHVDISYGADTIVRDISFSLKRGEILGLVGESGSGKTTVIRAAMGLLGNFGTVSRGNIFFDGVNIPDLSAKELRAIRGAGIGMIFQDAGASLCPIRTIGEQVFESLAAHRTVSKAEPRAAALEMFEKLHFRDGERVWESYPFELSGGMNQRAGIAIAMLLHPAVLLADEPTSALDVVVQRQVVQEMLGARNLFGTSIIIVSHDIGVVSSMADTMLVMKEGRAVEYGPTKEIIHDPQEAYTKELIAAVPRLDRKAG